MNGLEAVTAQYYLPLPRDSPGPKEQQSGGDSSGPSMHRAVLKKDTQMVWGRVTKYEAFLVLK